MKTLLVYASKYGSVKSCVKLINQSIESKTIHAASLGEVNPMNFDRIIIGASVYFGQIDKNLNKWLKSNKDLLLSKELFFFSCSKETSLEQIIDKNLLDHASDYTDFGYSLRVSEMTKIHSFITKKIAQTTNDCNHLKSESIHNFINKLV